MDKTLNCRAYAALAVLFFASPVALACCPSGGNTNPLPKGTGLGAPQGLASDSSVTSVWQISAYEKDGIKYIQISDQAGVPRAAIGYLDGDTYWAMPIGTDADRVYTHSIVVPTGATREVVYQNESFAIVAYTALDGAVSWSVERVDIL